MSARKATRQPKARTSQGERMTAQKLIAESQEHRTGESPVPISDLHHGVEDMVQWLLDIIDYENDMASVPAVLARALATVAADLAVHAHRN